MMLCSLTERKESEIAFVSRFINFTVMLTALPIMLLMLTLVLIMHTCCYIAQITFQNNVVIGVLICLNFYNSMICGFVGAFVPLKCVHGLFLIIHSVTSSCGVCPNLVGTKRLCC